MTPETLAAIDAHALAEYPREACGLVVIVKGRERYWLCQNNAETASEHFILAPADYAAAEDAGEVSTVVHSHPDVAARPSEADRVSCEASGLPWLIVSVMPGPVVAERAQITPSGYRAPLVGRTFHHGVLDCWTLCRDWYAQEMALALPNPQRADGWWDDGVSSLYGDDALCAAGFSIIWRNDGTAPRDIRRGDMILMQIRSRNLVPNHAGIYLGDGSMLHHMHGRLSSRDVYGGYWLENTRAVVRYTGVTQID